VAMNSLIQLVYEWYLSTVNLGVRNMCFFHPVHDFLQQARFVLFLIQ
jgi:hypothetical protein